MNNFINVRHDIIKQCLGNYKEMLKFNYTLEIEIFRNSTQNIWVSWGVLFKGLGVQKGTQTPCWLRPCVQSLLLLYTLILNLEYPQPWLPVREILSDLSHFIGVWNFILISIFDCFSFIFRKHSFEIHLYCSNLVNSGPCTMDHYTRASFSTINVDQRW